MEESSGFYLDAQGKKSCLATGLQEEDVDIGDDGVRLKRPRPQMASAQG